MQSWPAGTRLCALSQVEHGQPKGCLPGPDATRKVIVLLHDGRLLGWLDSCPHYAGGTPMAWRADAYLDGEGRHLACHAHGALFDIHTGECVRGPCLGRGLTAVPLALDDGGQVVLAAPLTLAPG